MAATPAMGHSNDHLTPTDEKMLLHIAMVIALFPRNKDNIDTLWELEQLKEVLDCSKVITEVGLPPLDTVSVEQALGKWQAKLTAIFGLTIVEYRAHRGQLAAGLGGEKPKARTWKVKFAHIVAGAEGASTELECRTDVEKVRQAFLRRKGSKKSQHECRTKDGLNKLLAVTLYVTESPISAGEKMDVCDTSQSSSEATRQYKKPYEELTSPFRRKKRLNELLIKLNELGWTTESLIAAAQDLEEHKVDSRARGASEESEEGEAHNDEGDEPQPEEPVPVDAAMLAQFSWDELASFCRRNSDVKAAMEVIEKRNALLCGQF